MREQIQAILWAQFRTIRNYLPRTNLGAILLALISLAWYGLFCVGAVGLAKGMQYLSMYHLRLYFPAGMLALLLFWQIFPILTMSSGWSLELNKLLVYPIHSNTLFVVELMLRLTTSPESVILLIGAIWGLLAHPGMHGWWPLLLLLYIPFNLLLSLAVRESMMSLFRKKRLREVLMLLIVSVSVVPSLLANTSLGERLRPYYLYAANGPGTPWHEFASLALGRPGLVSIAAAMFWLVLAWWLSRRQFAASLLLDFGQGGGDSSLARGTARSTKPGVVELLANFVSGFLPDPYGALVEKEVSSLLRTPRFRVLFGMACFFSVVIFFPMAFGRHGASFLASNYIAFVNTYGMLICGEVLIWNVFGFDRRAAQLYYVTPAGFKQVLLAKNAVAAFFIGIQTLVVVSASFVMPRRGDVAAIAGGIAISGVVFLFFLAAGNYASVSFPRPVQPNQTFRRQSGGKTQLILLASYILMAVPIGLAFLARWATGKNWVFFAVLTFDLFAAACFYYVSLEPVMAMGIRDRERIIDALSKGSDPIGLGLS
jgi:ABC-2 type transport system permease protein